MALEKTLVSPNTAQYGNLEYLLQLALHASSARILSAHALSNPHTTVSFEKRCKGLLTIDTWIDASVLTSVNQEDDVARRGFVFDKSFPGLRVPVGALRDTLIPKSSQEEGAEETKYVKRALLCKIGIGRAFPIDAEVAASAPGTLLADSIPEGYDSYYIIDKQSAKPADTAGTGTHFYIITGSSQILPMYVVEYEFDPVLERLLRERPKCDNCEVTSAEVYCAADAANLCKDCDNLLHSANKLASRHVRLPIGSGANVFGHCSLHSEKLVEFFCAQCQVPVCVHCKMVGHHSAGDAARHRLVSVSEAYQSVLAEAKSPDSILAQRKQAIASQMTLIQGRARSLEKHVAGVQAQIEDMFKRALSDLAEITRHKMSVLAGDTLELRRQRDEIHQIESFLEYQVTGDPTSFLFSWAKHQQMRAELHGFRYFRDTVDVQLDIKCAGSVAVLVESANAQGNVSTPNNNNTAGTSCVQRNSVLRGDDKKIIGLVGGGVVPVSPGSGYPAIAASTPNAANVAQSVGQVLGINNNNNNKATGNTGATCGMVSSACSPAIQSACNTPKNIVNNGSVRSRVNTCKRAPTSNNPQDLIMEQAVFVLDKLNQEKNAPSTSQQPTTPSLNREPLVSTN